ncbi:FadR family transcriptional regulator [Citricoccus nitrophenolicus]|uniref:GntR family transcriptional regulator n=1 Tax=Citricoccus muralis TaxID=169134 RepID=A0A3D9LC12_9MICC|nr:FadR/GntR family transcriptional regulator [Citricoccus muralis]REE03929.1 GntR family transcriptional regulator [Citricoccus muralis]
MAEQDRGHGARRVTRARLYEQLMERILEYIDEEGLAPGDRLPPERDLAEQFGVSRATLAQALVALEVLGVIDVRHGTGAVLVYRPNATTLLRQLSDHRSLLPEIVEARSTVEVKLAALAAERRTDQDLAAIDAAIEVMAGEIEQGDRGVGGDERFHGAITQAAHSGVLAQMMDFLSERIRETRIESLGQPGRPEVSLEAHRAIAKGIRRGDPDEAAQAMQRHIDVVSDVPLLRDAEG